MESIPVIDFKDVISSGSSDYSKCPQLEQLHSALIEIGFVFLKNHGIAEHQQIDEAFAATKKFFELPLEKKRKYLNCRLSEEGGKGQDGYISYQQEALDHSLSVGDLKEVLDFGTCNSSYYPDEEVPEFRTAMTRLYNGCILLVNKLLEMIGHALKLEDPMYMVKIHQKQGFSSNVNFTSLRANYYPPLTDEQCLGESLRCGEHIDYSSITLLFQSPVGGLQVKRRDGEYIDVPYVPDAVLVNLGHTMELLTNDLYIASPHRVLIPKEKEKRQMIRQSLAYFAHADNEVILRPLVVAAGETEKYLPISALDDYERIIQKNIIPPVPDNN